MPSTAIRNVSYDDQTRTLFVTFIDGDLYAYRGVARELYGAFKDALSKGRFFAEHIRDKYLYAQVPTTEEPTPERLPGGPVWRRPAGAGR